MQLSKQSALISRPVSLLSNSIVHQSRDGESKLFNNRMNAFYADTSFVKFTSQKLKQKALIESLEQKATELESQSSIAYRAILDSGTNEKWTQIKREAIKYHHQEKSKIEKAAITIQKVVRSYLTRIHYESYIVEIREMRTKFLVQEASRIANVCLFHLGMGTEEAAIVLQRGLKRYLTRLRFLRLIDMYHSYLEEKTLKAANIVRNFSLIYSCKEKLQNLSFQIFKKKRLLEIRENLAFISLKKFWRKRKLCFRIIKDKLLRLKRKKTALANKEAYQKLLTQGARTSKSPMIKSLTKTTNLDYDDDEEGSPEAKPAQEAQLISYEELEKAEKKRIEEETALHEKLHNSKLSHGLYEGHNVVVIPYFQERELNETISNSLEVHLFENTASIYRKATKAHRFQLPKIRNTTISSSPAAHHKRLSAGDNWLPPLLLIPSSYTSERSPLVLPQNASPPQLLTDTRSCRHNRESEESEHTPKRKRFHFENKFLHEGTIAASLKKSKKIEDIRKFKKWTLGNRSVEYTPGLENTAYTPQQWHPVKLDKSILETNTSTQYVKSHRRVGSNPASIVSFSSVIMQRKPRWSIDHISLSTYEGSTDHIPYELS